MKDAAHRFRLRESLAEYFCLGTALAHEMGLTGAEIRGAVLGPFDPIDLCWGSLLGLSWSLLFCQHVVSDITSDSLDHSESVLVRDRHAPQSSECFRAPWVSRSKGNPTACTLTTLGWPAASRVVWKKGCSGWSMGLRPVASPPTR